MRNAMLRMVSRNFAEFTCVPNKEKAVEMEMEVRDEMTMASERLQAAACHLEEISARLAGVQIEASLERVNAREAELEERLAAAEATIAALQAQASTQTHESLQAQGRKTPPAGLLVGKGAVALEAGALDAALESLTIEQRFAVKAGLLRGGLLG
jgi:chromosome segregation ATPase